MNHSKFLKFSTYLNFSVYLFKLCYPFFDKLLNFPVFCPSFIFSDESEFIQQNLRNPQGVAGQTILHRKHHPLTQY